jgi:hypothetical protein
MGTHPAPADQQHVSQSMIVSGGTGPVSVATLKAQCGNANVYQFTADFQFAFNQGIGDFRHGAIYGLHAPLKAALLAASAPMTQL